MNVNFMPLILINTYFTQFLSVLQYTSEMEMSSKDERRLGKIVGRHILFFYLMQSG